MVCDGAAVTRRTHGRFKCIIAHLLDDDHEVEDEPEARLLLAWYILQLKRTHAICAKGPARFAMV